MINDINFSGHALNFHPSQAALESLKDFQKFKPLPETNERHADVKTCAMNGSKSSCSSPNDSKPSELSSRHWV
jgi:hypothetical protein